jgi:hypothetical protein
MSGGAERDDHAAVTRTAASSSTRPEKRFPVVGPDVHDVSEICQCVLEPGCRRLLVQADRSPGETELGSMAGGDWQGHIQDPV